VWGGTGTRVPKFPGSVLAAREKKDKDQRRRGGGSPETSALEERARLDEGRRQKRGARRGGSVKERRKKEEARKKGTRGASRVSCHLRRTGGSRLLITRPSWSLFLPRFLFSLPLCLSLSLSPALALPFLPLSVSFSSTSLARRRKFRPPTRTRRAVFTRESLGFRLASGSGESAAVRRRMNESGVED